MANKQKTVHQCPTCGSSPPMDTACRHCGAYCCQVCLCHANGSSCENHDWTKKETGGAYCKICHAFVLTIPIQLRGVLR